MRRVHRAFKEDANTRTNWTYATVPLPSVDLAGVASKAYCDTEPRHKEKHIDVTLRVVKGVCWIEGEPEIRSADIMVEPYDHPIPENTLLYCIETGECFVTGHECIAGDIKSDVLIVKPVQMPHISSWKRRLLR